MAHDKALIETLETIAAALERMAPPKPRPPQLDAAEAFRLRILLVHEYRRIILRDPLLPKAMLPADWPGFEARRLCRDLYRATLARSEAWLDAHGSAQDGALPPPDADFARRFQDA